MDQTYSGKILELNICRLATIEIYIVVFYSGKKEMAEK